MVIRAYHFLEFIRQLLHDHSESSELLKHGGDVLTCEATDRVQSWTRGEE